GDGNDTILGGVGADIINGGAGIDTVDYTASSAAVNVNLAAGTASGGDAAGDVISNVENLTGSSFNDSLTGNTGANQLLGGAGNDSLFGGAGNDTIDGGAGTDSIRGGTGNDSLQGGTGNDTIYGGGDNDTIDGGANNDLIYGDGGSTAATNEHLSWSAQGADGTNIAAGFTQNTGTMNVNVGFRVDGNAATFAVETTDIQYTGGGPYSTTSSGFLFGNGDLDTSTTTLNFSAASGSSVQDEVSNVSFRVNDIDWGAGNHRDIVTVTAFNAAGNAVTVNITPGAGDTLSGNTVSGGDIAETSADAGGSALFSIAGPVARIVIDYNNGLGGTHGINVTDVHFTTIPVVPGNDSILGGSGNDTLFGEAGADTLDGGIGIDSLTGGTGNDALYVSQGDVAYGGDGEDNFYLTDLGEAGAGTITIDGGNSNEPGGDTLHLNGLVDKSTLIKVASPDDPDAFNGSVTMLDGTVVNFSRIERIICFTPGTMILTPFGERAIETLRPGDLVITRDHGPQPIRWLGNSTVPGLGELAPITIDPGVLDGATRQLQVSPQHRFLFTGYKAELLFGTSEVFVSAKHLVNGINVRQEECAKVAYLHLMLDQHEVIYADGTATESFFAGDAGVSSICDQARDEMFAIFPELRSDLGAYGNTARTCLKAHESRLLIQPQMDFGTLAAA
ncbi:MAG: Hint domain-containing protein, partial [Pseudorhodobacter sp.]